MRFIPILLLSFGSLVTTAQVNNQAGWKFLQLPPSPRVAALGGSALGLYTNDYAVALQNPSILQKENNGAVSINYCNYIADVNYGQVATAWHVDSLASFSAGLQYMNYGKFAQTSSNGENIGEFSANDLAFSLSAGISRGKISYGATSKVIYSQLYNYTAAGVLFDAAISYHNDTNQFAATAMLKNIGFRYSEYSNANEPVPFEIQAGISQKLKKAPFRYFAQLGNLQQWDLSYTDPNQSNEIDLATGKPIEKKVGAFQKAFLHFTGGLELVFSKNFYLSAGYNYRRRQELALANSSGLTGISYGFGLKTKRFQLNYAYTRYHVASSSHTFGLVFKAW